MRANLGFGKSFRASKPLESQAPTFGLLALPLALLSILPALFLFFILIYFDLIVVLDF
jgi:hypothetical protein